MKLSAILPLPASVAERRASVFTPVEGEPVLVRIVRALSSAVGDVVVVADGRLTEDVRSCLTGSPVQVISAGESPSTADCLAAAAPQLRSAAVTHALVADHRYPVIPLGLVARVVEALTAGAELVVPVLPVTDTVNTVDGQGTILSTVDRAELRITQYPYGATVQRLGDLHTVLGRGDGMVTVAGDADAVPIDLPADVALLAAIMACRR
ncbi:MAG: 2-C-methyl-D-erythritol 4-phosphate cytidylyltransferase [Microbacteriaceae bacterium]